MNKQKKARKKNKKQQQEARKMKQKQEENLKILPLYVLRTRHTPQICNDI